MTTATVREVINALEALALKHGDQTPVMIHDADTDWPLNVDANEGCRFGLDELGYGQHDAIMIASKGYHDE